LLRYSRHGSLFRRKEIEKIGENLRENPLAETAPRNRYSSILYAHQGKAMG
jgi:hypothetical protein